MRIDFSGLTSRSTGPLIQDTVAGRIRKEIIEGTLRPGDALVEGKWAKALGVAQASIRAALHILEAEGFVERGTGRSAQVTRMSDEDILHNFEVRTALEALAARLVTERRPELGDLDQAVADMRAAVECRNLQAFYERDMRFHLMLCEKSGNPVLAQILKRLLLPLFAFVIIRTHERMDSDERWLNSIRQHEKILAAIRTGKAELAVAEVNRVIGHFSADIHELTTDNARRQAKAVKRGRTQA